jgi:ArsR family transcriptional regulator, arsenate/arsenite/antimonite-responsive transcriptional repressor
MEIELSFRAVADPTRLRVLNLLVAGELCVGDLVTLLGQPQPTASRHLAYLRRAGLVSVRKRGLWSFYSLAEASRKSHVQLLECVRACAAEMPQLRKDALARRALLKAGGCCPR